MSGALGSEETRAVKNSCLRFGRRAALPLRREAHRSSMNDRARASRRDGHGLHLASGAPGGDDRVDVALHQPEVGGVAATDVVRHRRDSFA